mgnify:CR=1 FL=1
MKKTIITKSGLKVTLYRSYDRKGNAIWVTIPE